MLSSHVLELPPNPPLNGFNLRRKELHRVPAGSANHVVMISAIQPMLIPRNSVVKRNLGCQLTFGKELQRSVNGRIANRGILFFHQRMQFFRGEVLTRLKKDAQDGVAPQAALQSKPGQVPIKNLPRLCQHLR